jgi:4a-hydroxytetrahydrobiopterin dehydratase
LDQKFPSAIDEAKNNRRLTMNSILATKECTPCKGNVLPMTSDVANKLMNRVPGWALKDNATKIERTIVDPDFKTVV